MSKISELSDGGSLVSSDYLIAVRSGGNVKVRMDQINVDQIDLGDNEFIRLGNSQDLTIVHNASNSIINQAGIGDLLIQKAGSTKLTVNSSGIDVTGTIASGVITAKSSGNTDSALIVQQAGSTDGWGLIPDNTNGNLDITRIGGGTAGTHLSVTNAGNVGIGTDSPSAGAVGGTVVHVQNSGGTASVRVDRSDAATSGTLSMTSGNTSNSLFGTGAKPMTFATDSTERMRLDASGNVGVGTVPLGALTSGYVVRLNGGSQTFLAFNNSTHTTQATGGLVIGNDSTGADIYQREAQPLRFHTSNTERMRLDASGNASIGTSSAFGKLRVEDTGWSSGSPYGTVAYILGGDVNDANWGHLLVSQSGTTTGSGGKISFGADGANPIAGIKAYYAGATYGHLDFYTRPSGGTSTQRMRIDSSGNLNVVRSAYTSASTNGFHANADGWTHTSASNEPVAYFNRNTSDGDVIRILKAGTTVGSIATEGGDMAIGNDDAGIQFVNGTEHFRPFNMTTNAATDALMDIGSSTKRFKDLYLSGKIAKGTGGELDLRSDGGGFNYKQNLDLATAGATFTAQSNRGDVAAIRLYQTATGADGGYIRFDTCNSGSTTPTEKARILSDGSFLIGETSQGLSTNFKIQGPNVASTGFNTSFVSMGNSGGAYPYIGYNCAPTTTGLTYYKYVNDYASFIDFNTGQVRTFTTTAGGTGNTSGTAGPYVARGGTSWTSSSDRRLKDDVQEIAYGLDTVKALEPVSYVRNDRDVEKRELGFIAQDVEGVVDEVVSVTDDGYYGLDYQRLIPVLTKAIQEQQATIEALTARIAALES